MTVPMTMIEFPLLSGSRRERPAGTTLGTVSVDVSDRERVLVTFAGARLAAHSRDVFRAWLLYPDDLFADQDVVWSTSARDEFFCVISGGTPCLVPSDVIERLRAEM